MRICSLILLMALLLAAPPILAQQPGVSQAEYFWGTDPGEGNGLALQPANGAFDEALEQIFENTASFPGIGIHKLSIRMADANGNWGPVFTTPVTIEDNTGASVDMLVTFAECFWDTDPGKGNGTALVAFNGNFDEALETASGSIGTPAVGIHKFHIRMRDGLGNWGPVFTTVVQVTTGNNAAVNSMFVTAAEYFWDTDPGKGNGTALLAFNGNFDEAMETAFAQATAPTVGWHRFNIRMRDAQGHWGPVFGAAVEVKGGSTVAPVALQITAAEYFWNTDPGMGNGTSLLAVNGNFAMAMEKAMATASIPNTVGLHKMYIRVKDRNNRWGPTFVSVVEVLPSTPSPLPVKQLVAAEYFFDYDPGAGNATPMLAFDGNFNSVIEKIKGGNIPSPITPGPHTLYMRTSDAANHWGKPYGVVVTIDTTIGFTAHINGPANLCPSAMTGVGYEASLILGSSHQWTVTGGTIVSGAGTRNVVVNWNPTGPYLLTLKQCIGNGAFCDTARLVLTPGTNTSSNTAQAICQGQSFWGYTASGTYRDTLRAANGCDSIRTLVLTVRPLGSSTVTQTICHGQSYLGYTASGTYRDTFANQFGCDSVRTLQLTVRPQTIQTINQTICQGQAYLGRSATGTYRDTLVAANGCDSIRVLNLTVQASQVYPISKTLCYGGSYQGYNIGGTYTDTFRTAGGCDSIRTLYLTILPRMADTVSITLCQGNSYAGYTTPGTYVDTLSAITGCDSIRTLYLTVLPKASSAITMAICYGSSFAGYSATGVYRDTFAAANGCDSVRTLHLTVRPRIATTINQTICPGQSFLGYNVTGTYRDTFAAANGCDSVRTLHLTVWTVPQTVVNQSVCYGDGYLGYIASGTYRDTFASANGCDSVRVLNLTVRPQNVTTITVTACEGDTVAGYAATGTYVDTLIDRFGCDSIRTLHLTVVPTQVILNKLRICQGDSVKLGNAWHSVPGTFRDTAINASGCYDITITTLQVEARPTKPVIKANNRVLTAGTGYVSYQWYLDGTAITGATHDTFEVIGAGHYTVKVTNTSNCPILSDSFEWLETGVGETAGEWSVRFYPNPTTGTVYVELENAANAKLQLFNSLGQLLYQGQLEHAQTISLDLSMYAQGMYILRAEMGKEVITKKITKAQ